MLWLKASNVWVVTGLAIVEALRIRFESELRVETPAQSLGFAVVTLANKDIVPDFGRSELSDFGDCKLPSQTRLPNFCAPLECEVFGEEGRKGQLLEQVPWIVVDSCAKFAALMFQWGVPEQRWYDGISMQVGFASAEGV